MCKNIKANLVHGGKFVGATHSVMTKTQYPFNVVFPFCFFIPSSFTKYIDLKKAEQYGLYYSRPEEPQDGDKVFLKLAFNDRSLSYHYISNKKHNMKQQRKRRFEYFKK